VIRVVIAAMLCTGWAASDLFCSFGAYALDFCCV